MWCNWGSSCGNYERWVSANGVLVQFGDVTPFLEKHDEIAPTTRMKLLELLNDGKKKAFLQMELASPTTRMKLLELLNDGKKKAFLQMELASPTTRMKLLELLNDGKKKAFLQMELASPTTRMKLLELLNDGKKKAFLQMELASVVDAREPFVKSTYILEGDGPLFFKCYDQIQTLKAGIDNAHYPNVNALAQHLSTRGHTSQ